jgi:hypothetical protein
MRSHMLSLILAAALGLVLLAPADAGARGRRYPIGPVYYGARYAYPGVVYPYYVAPTYNYRWGYTPYGAYYRSYYGLGYAPYYSPRVRYGYNYGYSIYGPRYSYWYRVY